MNFGIVTASISGIYDKPSWSSTLISQLLYGHIFQIIKQENGWSYIRTENQIEAFINHDHILQLKANEYNDLVQKPIHYSFDIYTNAISSQAHIPIILGSRLPHFDGLSYKMAKNKIVYNGQVIESTIENLDKILPKIALKYLNSPMLKGGRTPFGIDEIGLIQMVYLFLGKQLGNSLHELKQQTQPQPLFQQAQMGDIVFFENNSVEKAGLVISGDQIIYSNSAVEVHNFDSHGIYDSEKNKYVFSIREIRKVKNPFSNL